MTEPTKRLELIVDHIFKTAETFNVLVKKIRESELFLSNPLEMTKKLKELTTICKESIAKCCEAQTVAISIELQVEMISSASQQLEES